jgi:hypothetical protein
VKLPDCSKMVGEYPVAVLARRVVGAVLGDDQVPGQESMPPGVGVMSAAMQAGIEDSGRHDPNVMPGTWLINPRLGHGGRRPLVSIVEAADGQGKAAPGLG